MKVYIVLALLALAAQAMSEAFDGKLSAELESALNDQINTELEASYQYMEIAQYFGRPDNGYRGLHKFFSKMSAEEREHGMKFIEYINKRQGTVQLKQVNVQSFKTHLTTTKQMKKLQNKPTYADPVEAMIKAERMEQDVYEKLLKVHEKARNEDNPAKQDPHLQDFLEGEFLTEQVDSLKTFKEFITILKRLNDSPLGLQMFDEELYNEKRG